MPNPAHLEVRFRCELPASKVPSAFGIVTAWNPLDRQMAEAANVLADKDLRLTLEARRWRHFRVAGGNLDFSHQEPGWGIEAPLADVLKLGRVFHQSAIFWIENDELQLRTYGEKPIVVLGPWSGRTEFASA